MVNPLITEYPALYKETEITLDSLIVNDLYIVNSWIFEKTGYKCVLLDIKPCLSKLLFQHNGPVETVEVIFYNFEKNEIFSIPRDELPFFHIRPL